MSSASHSNAGQRLPAICIIILMLMVSISQIQFTNLSSIETLAQSSTQPWDDLEQPWGQYGGSATRNGSMPMHDSQSGVMLSIDDPVINWVALDDDIGADAYGSIIGNFSGSLTVSLALLNDVLHQVCLPSFCTIAHQQHPQNYHCFQVMMRILLGKSTLEIRSCTFYPGSCRCRPRRAN